MSAREVLETDIVQGEDEKIVYSFASTPWGTGPTNVSFVVKDTTNSLIDVTSTVMPGSATVAGDVITLPQLKLLTRTHIYRVEIKFDAQGNTFEPFFIVKAER